MRSNHFALGLVALSLVLTALAPQANAGGPLIIFDAGSKTPYAYPGPVDMITDLGPLGAVPNASADALVASSAAEWSGVATSSFSASVVGDFSASGLPDINGANAGLVIGTDNSGNGIFVIFDTDGTVTQNFLGAPPGVLGVASPEFASGSGLTESWVVLNGATIDPGDLPGATSWQGVITHEMGHSINLAHTQTNGGIIFIGDDRQPAGCPAPYPTTLSLAATETMYPFIDPSPGSTGVQQATVEHLDDTATLSDLYPGGGYPGNFGSIRGTVFDTDGVTPVTGVNVIVRNLNDPFLDAQSALSGDFTQGQLGADGFYQFTGLTPGEPYVVYIDEILDGGFSTPPRQPLGAPEEFWNAAESNDSVADPPCDFTTITVASGQTVLADFQLNGAAPAPVIGVNPSGFSFSVPVDGSDTDVLNIENLAAVGSQDLIWSLVDAQPAIGRPLDGASSLDPSGIRARVVDAPIIEDSRDSALLRQCGDCGTPHESHVVPIDFGARAKAPGMINDGSFELGPFGGAWTESSTNFGTPICDTGTCGTGGLLGPRTGSFWTWFGGVSGTVETGLVRQSVVIPAASTTSLEFWYDVGGCDSAVDFMEVRVDGTPVFSIDGSAANCDGAGYTFASVDISAFADGASHFIEFSSETRSINAGSTNFFLDDVSLVQAVSDCPWLSASPLNGVTAPGTASPVTVQVDATGLAPGIYVCELRIDSNDPGNPVISVPVDLEVFEEPQGIIVDVFPLEPIDGSVSVFALPNGTGDPLLAAQSWSGTPGDPSVPVNATIGVRLTDGGGSPVVNFPANQIWVRAELGGWVQCTGFLLNADAPTDASGFTTISGRLFAGGHSAPGELMQVIVNDPAVVATNYPGGAAGLDYRVNSPDIAGDLAVNLIDVGDFSALFNGGSYDYAADFAWDGALNLIDVSRLATGIGAICPPPAIADTADDEPIHVPVAAEIGLSFDAAGRSSARMLATGQMTDAFVVLRGEAALRGIDAFDLRVRASENVVIHEQTLLDGFDLVEGNDTVAGVSRSRRATQELPLQLVHLRVSVSDEAPAYFWLEPSGLSEVRTPSVVREGAMFAAIPTSGDVEMPVASLNDESFVMGNTGSPRTALSMSIAPNPFNPQTEIRFRLPQNGPVELRVIDARGQLVTTLKSEVMEAGEHVIVWNGTDRTGQVVASGVYFSTLRTDAGTMTEKMLLVK